jgi:hypothetical protein
VYSCIFRYDWFFPIFCQQRHDGIPERRVDDAAMARVLNLLDVFELIVDAFDDRRLAQSPLIHSRHELVLPVFADLGDPVQATLPDPR